MIFRGIQFPYTHDLRRLLSMLGSAGEKISEQVCKADALTDYAGELRYQVFDEPVSEQDYEDAIAIAESVVAWAEGIVGYRVIGNEA